MIALKVLLTATIIPGILDFNPASILQGTLSAVLPHYQSASYAFYPSFAFQAIYVYDSRHHRNILPLHLYGQPLSFT